MQMGQGIGRVFTLMNLKINMELRKIIAITN